MYRFYANNNLLAGFDIPNVGAAKAAKRYACGFFHALVCPFMGDRGGGRKAASAPTRMSTRHVPPTPFDIGQAVTQPTFRSMTMSKSKSASAQNVSQNTKPRCRKGDLAIVLVGLSAGQIVDVVKHYPEAKMQDGEVMFDVWHIKHQTDDPRVNYFREDKYLLPIRPGDLEETETDELTVEGRQS